MAKTLRTKCLDAIQLHARISAADDQGFAECVTCNTWHHFKDMDGGHFIPKGNSSYWALEEENVHPQCKGCNGFNMQYGTASQEYTLWMIDFYGKDFVVDMLSKKKSIRKLYKADYVDMLKYFNGQINLHKKRIGV